MRGAIDAFVDLEAADRAAVVETLGLDRDEEALRLVVAPEARAEMAVAA